MTERAYLDYYSERDIIPVHQDLGDRERHHRRRRALYRILGVPSLAFRGSRILEVGPGTGDNALVTATFHPAEYVLLDGNPASIRALHDRLDRSELPRHVCRVVEGDLHHPPEQTGGEFDIVIAESCLHHQRDPIAALRAVAGLTSADGGLLVFTTSDEVAVLPDLCRRLLRPAIETAADGDPQRALDLACRIIDPHLATLPARSRPTRDWVLDTIFHPWLADWALPLPDAVDALADEFDFLGSSPSFLTDWRWYKEFADPRQRWHERVRSQWEQVSYATCDWRVSIPEPVADHRLTAELAASCRRLAALEHRIWHTCAYEDLPEVLPLLTGIAATLAELPGMGPASLAASDARTGLEALAGGELDYPFEHFRSWWGRNMQYLALSRRI